MDTKPSHIQENVSLAGYSTMRLGGPARYLLEVETSSELQQAVAWARTEKLSVVMLGGGSNTVVGEAGFSGLVIINRIKGLSSEPVADGWVQVTAGAGVAWDRLVAYSVEQGLSGLETLSYIPGTVGAAPIQNIGAYGAEISQVLDHLEALDVETGQLVTLNAQECGLGYRTSLFKTTLKGRYLITQVVFKLQNYVFFNTPEYREQLLVKPPYYRDVADYLAEHQISQPTPGQIRAAVVAIRKRKLPDPALVANCGSFFHNPIVAAEQFKQLLEQHPELDEPGQGFSQKPYWETSSGDIKLSAGWLLERCGLRGYHDKATGMATSEKQALVVINEHAKSAADLVAFRDQIVATVLNKWGITLVQEPEFIGS